jgi:hypothetical protein
MRDALERVASNFPDPPTVSGDEESGFEFAWENRTMSAGLRTYGKQVVVFLAEAEAEVTSISAASELLQGIFEDRFVAVATFKTEALVRCYIAPANDIGTGLNSPTHVYLGPIATAVDEVRIRSWSGALDAG